ncbi:MULTISPECIES: VanZ family protein [Colwellia]|uniref:Teicoplanin resistance protein VanZ n=1 Tax=Colwellia marinimaniae TaxID=1513592 RepID=A0ABQ0MR97_9GAMM|nr:MULTISPECIES: VanZ family protein [Colwellia]GAW94885.1 teicoplanin resistance protein VanZ [Colwellia marinimaniae]
MKARQHTYFFIAVIIVTILLLFAHEFSPDTLRKRIFQFPAIDTMGHLISFFILTWVSHSVIKLSLRLCVPLLMFYGALTEIGQSFLGYRSGEFGDFIADVIGISLFVLATWLYLIFFQKKVTKQR